MSFQLLGAQFAEVQHEVIVIFLTIEAHPKSNACFGYQQDLLKIVDGQCCVMCRPVLEIHIPEFSGWDTFSHWDAVKLTLLLGVFNEVTTNHIGCNIRDFVAQYRV
jgi:hypothetical protein